MVCVDATRRKPPRSTPRRDLDAEGELSQVAQTEEARHGVFR
jgi:hypothetical protein